MKFDKTCEILNPYTAERRDVLENTPRKIPPEGNLEGRGGSILTWWPLGDHLVTTWSVIKVRHVQTLTQTSTCYERVVLRHVEEEDGPESGPYEGEGRRAIEYPHPAAILHNDTWDRKSQCEEQLWSANNYRTMGRLWWHQLCHRCRWKSQIFLSLTPESTCIRFICHLKRVSPYFVHH